jgi:hypothetical protein
MARRRTQMVKPKADKYGDMKEDKDGGTKAGREVGNENATEEDTGAVKQKQTNVVT